MSGGLVYREAFLEGLKPDPMMTVSEWSDTYRMLGSRASAEPGIWRTSRTPYLREPMNELSSLSKTQRVVLMFGAQLGKSEAGLNWIGYIVHHVPGPALLVQPTVEMCKRLSKQRLESMFEETPVLSQRVLSPKSRDSGNTMMSKEFPGGILVLTGSNSPTGLRSMPCRYVFMDEVDAYPETSEGDPVNLAERRTNTFARRKIMLTSTPTVKGFSRIEQEYLRSDQRKFLVPCPSCGHYQALRWEQVKWENRDPETVRYECEGCNERFKESAKTKILGRGRWEAQSSGDGITAGFQLSSLYSPLGWRSWPEIVDDFLRSKNDPALLRVWVNTTLGEPYEDEYAAKVSAEGLLQRAQRDPHKAGMVPQGGVLLVAACDVQDTWLEVSVFAAGFGEEMWLIWHQKIEGDPAQSHVWEQLDTIRDTKWPTENGSHLQILHTAVDTGGHFTSEVYEYARRRGASVVPIKGNGMSNAPPLSRGNKVDVTYKGKTIKKGLTLYSVGTHGLKSTIYARLKFSEQGPGYIHFGELGTLEYLKGLTAERMIIKHVKGFAKREWVKPSGARNEPLDLLVYALAMVHLLYRRFNRQTMWQQFADALERQAAAKPVQKKARRSYGVGG